MGVVSLWTHPCKSALVHVAVRRLKGRGCSVHRLRRCQRATAASYSNKDVTLLFYGPFFPLHLSSLHSGVEAEIRFALKSGGVREGLADMVTSGLQQEASQGFPCGCLLYARLPQTWPVPEVGKPFRSRPVF